MATTRKQNTEVTTLNPAYGIPEICALFLATIVLIYNSLSIFHPYFQYSSVLTTICFVMIAIAACLISLRNSIITTVLSLATLLISTIVLCTYIYLHTFDVKFSPTFFTQSLKHMPANVALAFIIVSGGIFSLSFSSHRQYQLLTANLCGFISLTLSIVFLGGCFSGFQNAYFWGTITPVSLASAINLLGCSLTLIILSYTHSIKNNLNISKFLPMGVCLCFVIATVVISHEIRELQSVHTFTIFWAIKIEFLGVTAALCISTLIYFIQQYSQSVKEAQKTLAEIQATFEATKDGIVVIDQDGSIKNYNQLFLTLWDLTSQDMQVMDSLKLHAHILKKLKHKELMILILKSSDKKVDQVGDTILQLISGKIYEVSVIPQLLKKQVVGHVWNYRDVTRKNKLEEELNHMATHDKLTELPNKASLLDSLHVILNSAKKNKTQVSTMLIDIVNFNKINDMFGSSKSDYILKSVANRLRSEIKNYMVLGRYDGDQFLLITPEYENDDFLTEIIPQIFNCFSDFYEFFGNRINLECNVGIATFPVDARDLDNLLICANVALAKAKQLGMNQFAHFDCEMDHYSIQLLDLENQLHDALKLQQFELYYQPIFDLNNVLYGFEALIRWNHPEKGVVPPIEFLPVLESSGLMVQVDEWVIRQACQQIELWQKAYQRDFKIAINVSAQQFNNNIILNNLTSILENTEVEPSSIEIEIIESSLIDATSSTIETMQQVRGLGVLLSLDDFGSGYSSFNYIKHYPIDKLKIDQSFIHDIQTNLQNKSLVEAIITMSKALDITVLAEGVETLENYQLLEQLGVRQFQGYYFAHPMSEEQVLKYLNQLYPHDAQNYYC